LSRSTTRARVPGAVGGGDDDDDKTFGGLEEKALEIGLLP
jgi:hypothetical protein